MNLSVDTADLQAMSAVFMSASGDVQHARAQLAGADAPSSSDVVGSTEAAGQYADVLSQWLNSLNQLVSSLETMSRKMSLVADYYARTESGNVVHTAE